MNEHIVIDPDICHGKPVVRGTQTPVAEVLKALAEGEACETLARKYSITAEDIQSCIAFAAAEIDHASCQSQVNKPESLPRVQQLQHLFAEWTEEDSKLSDEQADRLGTALEAGHGLSFRSTAFD